MKGNRHTEPQRGVSERNRRVAAALGAEMGSLSRSITRRSDQNCKIILQILILQFCRQLVKKVLQTSLTSWRERLPKEASVNHPTNL